MFAKELIARVSSLNRPLLFGMIHMRALPGAPQNTLTMRDIEQLAVHEASVMAQDGLIMENMHDVPYARPGDSSDTSSTVAAMTAVCLAVTRACRPLKSDMLFGVQILAACNKEAMSIAHACELNFIRAEGFVFAHVADEGMIDGCAAGLMRHRRQIGADNVGVVADVRKKHSSHAITADLTMDDWMHALEFSLADGAVLTGRYTGDAADGEMLNRVRRSSKLPVFIGSGITPENVAEYRQAHGLIVGSSLKVDGLWQNEIDEKRVIEMRNAVMS